jgi:hypothetical protein
MWHFNARFLGAYSRLDTCILINAVIQLQLPIFTVCNPSVNNLNGHVAPLKSAPQDPVQS